MRNGMFVLGIGRLLAAMREDKLIGGYSHSQGQNANSTFLCPRASGLAPRSSDLYLLMSSLVE